MNSIWNNNLAAFQKRFPSLSQLTGNVPCAPETLWQLIKAKNGQISANEGSLHLHSSYNPQREAEGAFDNENIFQKSATVFYGFGLGYHVLEWCRRTKQLAAEGKLKAIPKLILIEPDSRYFLAAMTILDWTSVFETEQLVLALGCPVEQILPLIENASEVNLGETGVSDAFYFDLPAFQAHAKAYFDSAKTLIKRNQRKNEINAATLKKFGRLWCRNSLKNLELMKKLGSVAQLNNFPEVPFLVVGAGPSLVHMLPYMAELKKRMLIVCVETALKPLLKCGIQPDFIVLTDPQYWAYRHIAGLSAPEAVLISEVCAYPAVFRFNCKKIVLCASQFLIGKWFEKQLSIDPGELGTGGSVASSAWNFSYLCGAKKIFLAGLDFAFPDNQTHIRGSSAEQSYHRLSNRLDAVDKFTSSTIYSANAMSGVSYEGKKVVTDSRMKMFSWWFEARLAGCADAKTYTLCPQGLSTPGITPARVEEVLKMKEIPEVRKQLNNIIEKITPVLPENKINAFDKLYKDFPSEVFMKEFPMLCDYL